MSLEGTSEQAVSLDGEVFELHVWPGEWDLPSLDPECLTALCFIKFTGLNYKVVNVDNTLNLLRNDYPRLIYRSKEYIGLDDILTCIKDAKNINLELSDQNYADMLAQLNFFKEKFIPAFKILCWLDEENTYTVIRRSYGKHMRFPFGLIKLRQMARQVQNSILCNYRECHIKEDTLKVQMVNDAKECLNNMSNLLGINVFMFENQPSLIDAYLFGYLSILNKAPFVGSPLKSQLSICSNLCSLIGRTRKDFFAAENESLERLKQIERERFKNSYWYSFMSLFSTGDANKQRSSVEETEEWEMHKQRILVVGLGLVVMGSYALAMGIIKFNFTRTDMQIVEKSIDLD